MRIANKELTGIDAVGDEMLCLVKGYPYKVSARQAYFMITDFNDSDCKDLENALRCYDHGIKVALSEEV